MSMTDSEYATLAAVNSGKPLTETACPDGADSEAEYVVQPDNTWKKVGTKGADSRSKPVKGKDLPADAEIAAGIADDGQPTRMRQSFANVINGVRAEMGLRGLNRTRPNMVSRIAALKRTVTPSKVKAGVAQAIAGASVGNVHETAASVKAADLDSGDQIEAKYSDGLYYAARVTEKPAKDNTVQIMWMDTREKVRVRVSDLWVPDDFKKNKKKQAADDKKWEAESKVQEKKWAEQRKKEQEKNIPKDMPAGALREDFLPPDWKDQDTNAGDRGQLKLYKTDRFGWCIATLPISRGKGGRPDRTYGMSLDGKIVTMGNNTNIQAHTLYIRKSRTERLNKFLKLYDEGMGKAGNVRDRISSRRAQGQLMRQQGLDSWMWK